jgi:hypothetical protein
MDSNNVERSCPDQQSTASRTLDRVSHLLLSQPERMNRERSREGWEGSTETAQETPAMVLTASRPVVREQLLSFLREQPAALEEGMKLIDANLPCETPGDIELIALDGRNRLAIIDLDDKPTDSLLLRGLAHLDWVVRNIPLLRRTYQGQVINFSLGVRLFLLAPGFSPLFRCALNQIQPLEIDCVKYYTIRLPAGTGFFCERLFSSTSENRTAR